MLQLLSAGVISLWLKAAGVSVPAFEPMDLLSTTVLLENQGSSTQTAVQQYLKKLSQKGSNPTQQGIWIQSSSNLLAHHTGTTPLPSASLTKVATSLAALQTWGPAHQFITQIGATGPIRNGVLQGDLVIQGDGDPLFVWEEGIAVGNALNRIGITKVAGDLIITGNFVMNYRSDPTAAGRLLQESLNEKTWSGAIKTQYAAMPQGTPQPQVVVTGAVKVLAAPPAQTLLIRHSSLQLVELLRQMNIYSNNAMSEMLATSLGGAGVVAQQAAIAAAVPQSEIQLINGSGLSPKNRISPRAACGLFQAIQHYLQPYKLTIADVFPVAGYDRGTLVHRQIPAAAAVKTGTLADVSALAGIIPTQRHGLVWFAIINRGNGVEAFRAEQDRLLQTLQKEWGTPSSLPAELKISPTRDQLGQASRNQVLLDSQSGPSSG